MIPSDKITITGGTLVLPDRLKRADLFISGGLIHSVEPEERTQPTGQVLDARGKYVLPGFIDIHNHGAAGFDFTFGLYDTKSGRFRGEAESFREGLSNALAFHAKRGVTRIVLTTMAADRTTLEMSAVFMKKFMAEEALPAGMVEGINLEGTFLKQAEYAGAHNPEFFYPPQREIVDRLQSASGQRLKIVNLPPEQGAEGRQLTSYLQKAGVIIAGGHSGAMADQFDRAIAAGLRLGVHFLNGPSRSSTKSFHGGGAVEAMLRADGVSLELIPDGYHVHPAYIRDTLARKGMDKIILITDSMFANGMSGLRSFELNGLKGRLSDNGRYLQLLAKKDALFGSVLSMKDGFANMLTWLTQPMPGVWYRQHPGLSFEEALVNTSKMASSNPARLLGIDGSEAPGGAGSIETGKSADLLIAEIDQIENGWRCEVETVLIKGNVFK